MKNHIIILLISTIFLSACATHNQESKSNDSSTIGSSYFGQKPPGLIPEIFAPGIVSINGRYEHGISFSPDVDEVYFSANKKDEDPSIYFSKFEDKKWTNPRKANFTKGKKVGEMHPFVNLNGDKIYFTAHDEFTLPQHKESIKTWYVNRLENSWSKAIMLDSPVNDDFVFYPNQAKNGDLFYTNVSKFKMYYAPNKDGKFPEVKEVGIEFGIHGFISPNQDFLVVNVPNKEDATRKDNDIYVCFKEKDGTWTKPINLGNEVNSNFGETCPSITPDGKYLFFSRYDEEGGLSNFYWVSTEVIHKLRPVAQKNNVTDFDFPALEGPYMGQKPPGLVAEPFAPGIISKDGWEIEGVFAPGMKEFYFTTRSSKETPITVIGFRQQNNVWKKYVEFKRKGEISFSPDGSRMHMAKGYKDRNGDDWSERKSLGPMFDRKDWGIMRLTASTKGTYVFDDYKSGDVIRIASLKDGQRQEPQKMGPVFNTGKWTAHPFIAPDESYLIWDSERKGGYGDSDLYISFRQEDGSWGSAINMGDSVNSDKWEAYASVTSDGKYILFNRRIDDGSTNDNMNVDIYWVDAQIIENLRPE